MKREKTKVYPAKCSQNLLMNTVKITVTILHLAIVMYSVTPFLNPKQLETSRVIKVKLPEYVLRQRQDVIK